MPNPILSLSKKSAILLTNRASDVLLEFGGVYLAKNNVEKAFDVFVDYVLGGLEGLCITRIFPPKIRSKYGLEKTPIVWLTGEKVNGQVTADSLQDLSILIWDFLDKPRRSIVILDGAEYLIANYGFESFIRFLQLNRSRFEKKESILVVPIIEEAMDPKHVHLMERETIFFPPSRLTKNWRTLNHVNSELPSPDY